MIRFIDIRNQGTASKFAFFNTADDSFLVIEGESAWDSRNEFEECAKYSSQKDRCVNLMPDWANDGKPDLLPCPICNSDGEVRQMGTARQSMI